MPTLEQRFRDWQRNRADMKLFRHLSEVHRIEPEGVELLTDLADHHELVRASEIFLRPTLFDTNPTSHPDVVLAGVRNRLFGPSPEPAPKEEDSDLETP